MLTLVLAETELELVPEEIRSHPQVRRPLQGKDKRASRTLLDASLHHEALKYVHDGERRGRPDLPHLFMVLGLDSIANKRNELKLLVHTRHDELITIAPDTRIMRNYPRFVGLMEQLFQFREVPRDLALLKIEEGWTLERVLAEKTTGPRIALSEEGRKVRPIQYFAERKAANPDLVCVLGGFPKGNFRSPVSRLVDETISIYPDPLSVWIVQYEILSAWEDACGFLTPPA
ncbi:MAG TPA: 16S rRNA methyltransferase [Candidatus Thermoplasmatota archaeon]|nr:16S rRNA methyltransferase [Candidatus Thermoplasmatota archaeon]